LSRDLVAYESIVGSCFNQNNFVYLHDWFNFVLSSVIHVMGGFFAKVYLYV